MCEDPGNEFLHPNCVVDRCRSDAITIDQGGKGWAMKQAGLSKKVRCSIVDWA